MPPIKASSDRSEPDDPVVVAPTQRGRRVTTIVAPTTWMVFLLLYVGFWSSGISPFEDGVVFLASILFLGAVVGSAHAVWGPPPHWTRT